MCAIKVSFGGMRLSAVAILAYTTALVSSDEQTGMVTNGWYLMFVE